MGGKGKESNDITHLTGLCLKPLHLQEYLNNPPAMATSFHTEQMHSLKLDFRRGVKYTDPMVHKKNNENTLTL